MVLAAGSYGTPAILQRSGVGDPALLRAAGIEPLVDLPGVGRNLHDHPLAEVEFAGSEDLKRLLAESAAARFTPEEQTLGKLRSSRATGPVRPPRLSGRRAPAQPARGQGGDRRLRYGARFTRLAPRHRHRS